MKKTHVLINALHAKTGGGVVYLGEILPFLAAEPAFRITVLCQQAYRDRLKIPENVAVYEKEGDTPFFKLLLWEQTVLPWLARSKFRAEVTFCAANYVPLLAPKPVAYITNNPDVRHFVTRWQEKAYWLALIMMTRAALMVCPVVLSNGLYLKDIFAKGLFARFKHKFRNAPAACGFVPPVSRAAKQAHTLLAIGDFYPHKDHLTLIQAVAELVPLYPDIRLNIVGRPVRQDLWEQAEAEIRRRNLQKNVYLLGPQPHEKVAELFADCTAYVSASNAETFSLTLLEALTMGVPAVIKDYPFQREVAGNAGAFYVPLKGSSAQNFASTLNKVFENAQKVHEITGEGKNQAAKVSWEKSAQAVIAALKEAARS